MFNTCDLIQDATWSANPVETRWRLRHYMNPNVNGDRNIIDAVIIHNDNNLL